MKDELFKSEPLAQFKFDENVAAVFDDMVKRSIPFYEQNLATTASLCAKLAVKEAVVCELGCSSANTLLALFKLRKDLSLFGVDKAKSMLEIASKKAKAYEANISFECADILSFELKKADIYILNYTLQFIRPMQRLELLKRIKASLNEGGFLILSEKISFLDPKLGKNIIELYEEYKESKGYLKTEIARKRRALENVMIPFSEDENKQLLKEAGFSEVQSYFKWLNFMSFIAFA